MSQTFEETLAVFTKSVADCRKRSPHLNAYAELKTEKPETADLLNLRAADLFEEICREMPEDPFALHHLAIIYHGLGYQFHLEGKAADEHVIEYWRRGLRSWARRSRPSNNYLRCSN